MAEATDGFSFSNQLCRLVAEICCMIGYFCDKRVDFQVGGVHCTQFR